MPCVVRSKLCPAAVLTLTAFAGGSAGLAAQQSDAGQGHLPSHTFVVAGYGTAGWRTVQDGGVNSFFGSLSPLLLFQFGERLLFEAELEFEIEDGVTQTGLEYAQVDYFLNDNLTLVAGKFLVPFGVFGERLHPTWINRSATNPPIYGHAQGIHQPLLPIMADFGAMLRGSWALGGGRSLIASAFVTQGPFAEAGHDEAEAEPAETMQPVAPRLEFAFGEETTDLSDDKMVGGRIGWVAAPAFEVDVSGMTGEYNEHGARLDALNLSAEVRAAGAELRGELVGVWYDVEAESEGEAIEEVVRTVRTGGFYVQASRRFGRWEPVLRWTKAFDATGDGLISTDGYRQFSLGLDYWLSPSIAIMAGYEINDANEAAPDRFVIHWSFGF